MLTCDVARSVASDAGFVSTASAFVKVATLSKPFNSKDCLCVDARQSTCHWSAMLHAILHCFAQELLAYRNSPEVLCHLHQCYCVWDTWAIVN